MATSPSVPLSVEQLLEAVDHLSPHPAASSSTAWPSGRNGTGGRRADEAALIRAARRLPAAAERRLKRLIARSERGDLTPQELADYRALAREAQRIDAAWAEALVGLARRRRRSVEAVKAELGCEGETDGA